MFAKPLDALPDDVAVETYENDNETVEWQHEVPRQQWPSEHPHHHQTEQDEERGAFHRASQQLVTTYESVMDAVVTLMFADKIYQRHEYHQALVMRRSNVAHALINKGHCEQRGIECKKLACQYHPAYAIVGSLIFSNHFNISYFALKMYRIMIGYTAHETASMYQTCLQEQMTP